MQELTSEGKMLAVFTQFVSFGGKTVERNSRDVNVEDHILWAEEPDLVNALS